MLSPKIMPQKTYAELMDENISKIPIYTDEWTNYNPSDPGITILENLSGAQIIQQNRMDEVTSDVKAKLLKLLGHTPRKGKGARVYLEPEHVSERFSLLADQRFMVGDICYETNRPLEIVDSHITGVFGCSEESIKDFSFVLDKNVSMPARIFGKDPQVDSHIYIVMDKPLKPGEQGIIHIDVANDHGRNPFFEEQKGLFSQMKWECFCENGFVEMEVSDGTVGFLIDGEITFTQPMDPADLYEQDGIRGYVWRATLIQSNFDCAPALKQMSGFLFQVVQKETLSITHSFQKEQDICVKCNLLEDGYVSVFAKEQKGSSYRKYEECVDGIYSELPKGRYYRKTKKSRFEAEFTFDKDTFGYAPANIKNPVKILIYNEEMMRKYYLGNVYGYDNQEIKLPVGHVLTETFCIIARREDGEGGYLYDFLKPNKREENMMFYNLFEEEGKIVIREAGDYIGASLFLGSVAVIAGEDGNIRKGNRFYSTEIDQRILFTNPAKGVGGSYQESLEQVRRRFISEINTPQTAVIETDYEKLVKKTPGLCIGKARAWRDDDRNEVQIAVMPKLEQEFPQLSDVYLKVIDRYMQRKRLLSTAIRILQPVYVPVNVSGKIYVKPHFNNCERLVKETVVAELDYIRGNQNFGEPLRFDKVFHALDVLECVSYVYDLNIESAKPEYISKEGADLYPVKNCLFYPGIIALEVFKVTE